MFRLAISAASRAGPVAILAALLALAPGCATRLKEPVVSDPAVEAERRKQMELALTLLLERQVRVWEVGNRVRRAGAALCGDSVHYTFGFFAIDRETFAPDYRDVAADLGLGPGLRIWQVHPDFRSDDSGLRRGDQILDIEGLPIAEFRSFEKALRKPLETGRMTMGVERETGEKATLSLTGVLACDYRVAMAQNDAVNAFADGRNVFLTTGMVRFVESDHEMALVVGHELAHNALGHLKQKRAQVFAGLLADLAIAVFGGVNTQGAFSQLASIAFSEGMETDADYMGIYLAARANYEIEPAPDFWRRMAVEHPGTIRDNMMATHPSSPERAVSLRRSIEEVEAKRSSGAPLLPAYE